MNWIDLAKNPLIVAFGKEVLNVIVDLVKSLVIPKAKRVAFEKMSDGLQEFGEFILEQKEKVLNSPEKWDDEAYLISKDAFKKFLDEANALYLKM